MKTDMKHFPLRLPPELHQQVECYAQQEERSVNNMLIRLIRQALVYYSDPTTDRSQRKTFKGQP